MFKATARTLMKTFRQFMDEDAPVNNVGGGAIAGAVGGETPPAVSYTHQTLPTKRIV